MTKEKLNSSVKFFKQLVFICPLKFSYQIIVLVICKMHLPPELSTPCQPEWHQMNELGPECARKHSPMTGLNYYYIAYKTNHK